MNPLKEISLAGTWLFTPEGGRQAEIQVPGGGWLKQGFNCEAGLYETEIFVPDICDGQVTRLEFDAVNHLAEYYIDGHKVYEEVTAFTPQTVDITPHVKSGKSCLLKVFVRAFKDGRPVAPHWAEWSKNTARGIFRGAFLRIYPPIYIVNAFVKTSVKNTSISYEAWIHNSTQSPVNVTLNADFGFTPVRAEVAAGSIQKLAGGAVAWNKGAESYWWPNMPYKPEYRAVLHKLELDLESFHKVSVRFGFRELRQEGKFFTLNGIPIKFRGDNLQVANYDGIDNDGYGDAIDTLPGFLPPSADNPGWPRAVDNFQRINYNIQRTHMGPWTPYMLDVCDEMGLMLIGESACRWNGFDMENGRGFYEEKCLADIVKRDRNHPSVVRWCVKNEPQCLDPEYHVSLYNTVKEHDNTRPVCEAYCVAERETNDPLKVLAPLLEKNDFSWTEHYQTADEKGMPVFSPVLHNDICIPLEDRPYGIGEADWMRSSTPAGLTWFATTVAMLRAQGASDIRTYTLLSGWCGCIAGTKTTDFVTEENRHPVWGEDNLPDPWRHDGIRLLQHACNPVFAMDYDFWEKNAKSDAHGHFPIVSPVLAAGKDCEREITVFNDDLFGSELILSWSFREGSHSNTPFANGTMQMNICPAHYEKVKLKFRAPVFNCFVFLTLAIVKNGEKRFLDKYAVYEVSGGRDYTGEFDGEERKFL